MFRFLLIRLSFLPLLLTLGCNDKAADMQKNANSAQTVADAKIEDAKTKANKDILAAQAVADKKIADQQANFDVLREEYRHAMTIKFVDFDQKVAVMDANAKKATGKTKADLDARLSLIRTQQAAFMTNYKRLDNESATTWDATKLALDSSWAELDKLVSGV